MRTGSTGKKFRPGHLAPITGIYWVSHGLRHREGHEVVIIRGEPLPICRTCKLDVSYEIVRPVSHITHDWDFSGPSNLMVKPLKEDPRDFRLFSRAQIQLPIQLYFNPFLPSRAVHGFCSDLSVGGMGAVLRSGLPSGYANEKVKISIKKGREALSVQARLRYQNGMRYGFEFINVGAAERETIRRLISKGRMKTAVGMR